MSKSNAKVILVDDNPVILDILRRGIEPYAEAEAYRKAIAAHCSWCEPTGICRDSE